MIKQDLQIGDIYEWNDSYKRILYLVVKRQTIFQDEEGGMGLQALCIFSEYCKDNKKTSSIIHPARIVGQVYFRSESFVKSSSHTKLVKKYSRQTNET